MTAATIVLSSAAITDEGGGVVPVILWDTALSQLRVDHDDFIGQRFTLRCPERKGKDRRAVLSGTNTYTSDSSLCFAAAHAGVVQPTGGSFTVQLNPGAESGWAELCHALPACVRRFKAAVGVRY
ncbi:MAG: LCCL domain-containing protein [Pseudomonadales bacterium]